AQTAFNWHSLGATEDIIKQAVDYHIAACHEAYRKEMNDAVEQFKASIRLAREKAGIEETLPTEAVPSSQSEAPRSPIMRKWGGFRDAVARRARTAKTDVTKGVARVKQAVNRIFHQSRLEPSVKAAKLPLVLKASRPAVAPSFKKMPTMVEMEKGGI
ncbi:MAG: hypothetical protein M1826_004761, partial [Phylliscum demangeonii]